MVAVNDLISRQPQSHKWLQCKNVFPEFVKNVLVFIQTVCTKLCLRLEVKQDIENFVQVPKTVKSQLKFCVSSPEPRARQGNHRVVLLSVNLVTTIDLRSYCLRLFFFYFAVGNKYEKSYNCLQTRICEFQCSHIFGW